ncbi:MAG TPA: hypothetical protein VEH06_04880, partial [Candidatus Bathyarchaeia archaeon]|nr:hypothetical protein [Candidatus Bathyarchaeia archaeon]
LVKKPEVRFLVLAGLIGGGPTFLGTVLGSRFHYRSNSYAWRGMTILTNMVQTKEKGSKKAVDLTVIIYATRRFNEHL